MEKELQEKFDALIAEYGAAAVIAAIKGHYIQPDGGGCTATSCPIGYYCNGSICVLDVG